MVYLKEMVSTDLKDKNQFTILLVQALILDFIYGKKNY